MLNWETTYHQWWAAIEAKNKPVYKQVEAEAVMALMTLEDTQLQWHLQALACRPPESEPKTWFLSAVYRSARQMPETLFAPLIQAAVYEVDPSYNRRFVDPGLRCFGVRRVNTALLRYAETGTDAEKNGASNAFYWSLRRFHEDEGIAEEPIEELRLRERCWRLSEFVSNTDVALRRSLVPGLRLKPELYPEALQGLILEAIQIARDLPDAYIRHRIEIQLGSGGPLQALPHRPADGV